MCADFGVFGDGDIVSTSLAEAGDVDGLVEAAELADLFEVLVHLLVGDDGKGQVSGEIQVFVFVQNGLGMFVELNLEVSIGLLSSDGEDSVLDIVTMNVGHVRIAEGGEGAEAEEVSRPLHAAGIKNSILVLFAIVGLEFDDDAGLGYLEVVEFVQLFFGEEDDGLFDGLEDGLIAPQTITASI